MNFILKSRRILRLTDRTKVFGEDLLLFIHFQNQNCIQCYMIPPSEQHQNETNYWFFLRPSINLGSLLDMGINQFAVVKLEQDISFSEGTTLIMGATAKCMIAHEASVCCQDLNNTAEYGTAVVGGLAGQARARRARTRRMWGAWGTYMYFWIWKCST